MIRPLCSTQATLTVRDFSEQLYYQAISQQCL